MWQPEYVTLDDGEHGTGLQTSSVAVLGPNRFVALVSVPENPENNIFNTSENYLVGYWDADSVRGRVTYQEYAPYGQKEVWSAGDRKIDFNGAWQITGGQDNLIYVANNDENHSILVFELLPNGVRPVPYSLSTGKETIFAIAVADNGSVLVADYYGSDDKNNELRIYPAINQDLNLWHEMTTNSASPVASIDLPGGVIQGIAVNNNCTVIYVSLSSTREIIRFTGSVEGGYRKDTNFNLRLKETDVVNNPGSGIPTFLGLDYSDPRDYLFAATDVFLLKGMDGAYPYGRIYVLQGQTAIIVDTIDIAANNLARIGEYVRGSANGLAGGYASVYDVEVDDNLSVYTQTYYGWAIEKWTYRFDYSETAVSDNNTEVLKFSLEQNFPNPFNESTRIKFTLPADSHVLLEVCNILGEKVSVLADAFYTQGMHSVVFDGTNLASGCYIYFLRTDSYRQVRKMVFVK
ncbi:MAG: hypothetical protein H6696_16450 [Deferribacteres bacterium]|nr:hypothetical protein [candidate division KSB1 bacterium]MCB9503524.1 hypothetical protein [Deferribacteres bacterium]